MDKVKIKTNLRESVGKGASKQMRRKGNIPAVIYGQDINLSVDIPLEAFKVLKLINFSESAIIDMEVVGAKENNPFSAMIKDVQYDPLTEKIIHVDFLKVSLTEKIRVYVNLQLKGEPEGVKQGAVIEQVLREIEVEALPLDIPEKIEIDVSGLAIGHSLHVKDLQVPGNVKILTGEEETIAALVAHKEEEEPEEVAAAEGVPAAEPEVIKEKKEATDSEEKEE